MPISPSEAFAILGIPQSSTPNQVKKCFRNMVSIAHPDKGGDAEAFIKRKASYDIAYKFAMKQYNGKPDPCPACAGDGRVKLTRGFGAMVIMCKDCRGSGVYEASDHVIGGD